MYVCMYVSRRADAGDKAGDGCVLPSEALNDAGWSKKSFFCFSLVVHIWFLIGVSGGESSEARVLRRAKIRYLRTKSQDPLEMMLCC